MEARPPSFLRPNEISSKLRSDTPVWRWPEDPKKPAVPTSASLFVDAKGYYLICRHEDSKDDECFDIALIHDTRTGTQVTLPQDAETCKKLRSGELDVSPKLKCLTIVYGNSFVVNSDLRTIHFFFRSSGLAREWADQLFKHGHSQHLRNLSSLECLEKLHTKVTHGLAQGAKDKRVIPVASLVRFLCKNRPDSRRSMRIWQALGFAKLPCQEDSMIDPAQFTFDRFFRFYTFLMDRQEIDRLFNSLGGNHHRLRGPDLQFFIQNQEGEDGEFHRQDFYAKRARDLLQKYDPHDERSTHEGMSKDAFLRYLLSSDNLVFDPSKLDLFMEMTKPLAHYFIASSHNTYLTGSQLVGSASVEIYRQVLLTGCRCIELDVLDGEKKTDEPEISHKNTPVRRVLFREVLLAIREYAFKVTPFPLTLSLENHCSPITQKKMARYLVDILGDLLITEPLKSHPCEEGRHLPGPNDLKNKILIKNKKIPIDSASKAAHSSNQASARKYRFASMADNRRAMLSNTLSLPSNTLSSADASDEIVPSKLEPMKNVSLDDDDLPLELGSTDEPDPAEVPSFESEAMKEMSDLVHYIVPVRFVNFNHAQARNRSFEISSFTEDRARDLIRCGAKEFLSYNQRQLSRIYPRGTRFDSSNFDPYLFWPAGCQMVALNYQTLDTPMQVNLGLFSFNAACGYLEKPAALCQSGASFNPATLTSIENTVQYKIDLRILTGQFLCQDSEPTFVSIKLYGIHADVIKQKVTRVRAKFWNGFQAIYDDSDQMTVQFSKILLPEMAAIHFSVISRGETLIGQSFVPVAHLQNGYRHIALRNAMNIPVNSSSLFIYVQKKIHVNDQDMKLVNVLSDPLSARHVQGNGHGNSVQNPVSDRDSLSYMPVRYHLKPSGVSVGSNACEISPLDSSEFHQRERLCKDLSLNDLQQEQAFKQQRNAVKCRLKRLSWDYEKPIRIEENALRQYLLAERTQLLSARPSPAKTGQGTCSVASLNMTAETSTGCSKNMPSLEQRLLSLYEEKYHQQQDLECSHAIEYYQRLEQHIRDELRKQLNELDRILAKETVQVNDWVRKRKEADAHQTQLTESNRDSGVSSSGETCDTEVNAGSPSLDELKDMHKELVDLIQRNSAILFSDLEEQQQVEMERCTSSYADRFNTEKYRLEYLRHINTPSDCPDDTCASSHA